jgi:hypothetical protein
MKSAACCAFMAIPLLMRNFFCTDIIKFRGNIANTIKASKPVELILKCRLSDAGLDLVSVL